MYGHATPPLSPIGMVLYLYFRAYERKRVEVRQAILRWVKCPKKG